jgi:hypothetical protein
LFDIADSKQAESVFANQHVAPAGLSVKTVQKKDLHLPSLFHP